MKTFNYKEVIESVLAERVDTLMFVVSEKAVVDRYGDIDNFYNIEREVYFAGTTIVECQNTINYLVSNCEADKGEQFSFFACQCPVSAESFEEYDPEYDDEEDLINDYINGASEDSFDNVGTSDWNEQIVTHEYERLENSIILRWRWHTYVGYARKAIELEYCIDGNMTTQICMKEDSTTATQIDRLVSAEDVKDCATATDLINLIQQRIDDMGKWRNNLDVEKFVRELYEDSKRYPSIYTLPENDLQECEEE